MERIFSTLLLLGGTLGVSGQTTAPDEAADSVPVTLKEVVVEGSTQQVIRHGVEFIPDKKVKKASHDAISLLFHMNIPQLIVSPFNSSVTTPTGAGVSLFIDYVAATDADVQGLRPDDVLRVEVLDYPQDPRFNSTPHVVNFIMRRYEWGGYTKLTAFGRTLNENTMRGYLYQKFTYKGWTFDASAFGRGIWSRKYRDSSVETFRDFWLDGNPEEELTRTSETTRQRSRTNSEGVSLRGAYRKDDKYIAHSVSFLRNGMPETANHSSVSFSGGLLPSTQSVTEGHSQSLSVAVDGTYRLYFPHRQSLNADWSFRHSGTRQSSLYSLGDLDPIDNCQRERAYSPAVTVYYSWGLGHDNTFRTKLSSYANIFDTRYGGSYGGRQRLLSNENMLFLEYMQNFGSGLSLYTRVGASYVLGRFNGENRIHSWSPRLGVSLQKMFNRRHGLSLEAWWANSHPQESTSNGALVQTHELMWIQGNPALRNMYGPMASVSYNWMPSNRVGFNVSARYNQDRHSIVIDYRVLPSIDGVVRTYSDNSTLRVFGGSLGGSLRLLNNSFILYVRGNIKREWLKGAYPIGLTWAEITAQASYYVRNLSLTLYYQSPSRDLASNGGYRTRVGPLYGFLATYSLGNFQATFYYRNWFNNGHAYMSYHSPHYSINSWRYLSDYAPNMDITLTYTIPYGKKLDRNDELQNKASKQSAILE